MTVFHRLELFAGTSKWNVFAASALRWAPRGFVTWIAERDQSPGMVNLRKNRECAREVAERLIEEKRQGLKDGNPRRDLLSLLGLSCVAFAKLDIRCNTQFFSQSKFGPTTRIAAERRRDRRPGSVRQYPLPSTKMSPTHPRGRTMMFAGHETVTKTVSFFKDTNLWHPLTSSTVISQPLGTCEEPACPRKTSSRNYGNPRENQGQRR